MGRKKITFIYWSISISFGGRYGSTMVILFDVFNLSEDIYEIIFATEQQQIVAKAFVDFMKANGGEVDKTTMSLFATRLHDGDYETQIDKPQYRGKIVKLSYNKRQFYDRILTPMKSMGMIYYDLYRKTYKVSDRFNKEMIKVGVMWNQELQKKGSLNIKS
jgi:hypothetical protein